MHHDDDDAAGEERVDGYGADERTQGVLVAGRFVEGPVTTDAIDAALEVVERWSRKVDLPLVVVPCGDLVELAELGDGGDDDVLPVAVAVGVLVAETAVDDMSPVGPFSFAALEKGLRRAEDRLPREFWDDVDAALAVGLADDEDAVDEGGASLDEDDALDEDEDEADDDDAADDELDDDDDDDEGDDEGDEDDDDAGLDQPTRLLVCATGPLAQATLVYGVAVDDDEHHDDDELDLVLAQDMAHEQLGGACGVTVAFAHLEGTGCAAVPFSVDDHDAFHEATATVAGKRGYWLIARYD